MCYYWKCLSGLIIPKYPNDSMSSVLTEKAIKIKPFVETHNKRISYHKILIQA